MKTRLLTLIFALTLLTSAAIAQDYTFKVLANKGTNEVKTGESWAPLKTGASLKAGDEVKLADNAYIGLVHSSGKPMELKSAGSYKVSDLAAKIGGGSSVLNKYTDFILSSNSAEAKKNRLSATGAVHRATESASTIKVILPENQYAGIYNTVLSINWEGDKLTGPFIVTLRNMFDDELAKIETPESSIQVDLNDPKYATENAILVEVALKSDPKQVSKQHLVKKLLPAEQEKVKKSLNEFFGEVQESTALNKLLLAGFYEQNNLYIDAIAAYEAAVKLAPDVPTYKESYDEFLLRVGLKK